MKSRERERKNERVRKRDGGYIVKKLHFYFVLCPNIVVLCAEMGSKRDRECIEHTENCCKPIVWLQFSHSGQIEKRFIDGQMVFANIHKLMQSAFTEMHNNIKHIIPICLCYSVESMGNFTMFEWKSKNLESLIFFYNVISANNIKFV